MEAASTSPNESSHRWASFQSANESRQSLGYYAEKRGEGAFCDKTALIVTGTEATLRDALRSRGSDPATMMIKKARMGTIAEAMAAGAAYSFDAVAYERFAPEAETIGIPRQQFDFTPSAPGLTKMLVLEPRRND